MHIINKFKSLDKRKAYWLSIAAVAFMFAASLLFSGRGEGHANTSKHENPVAVSVVTVQPRQVESIVSASGALSSRNTSVLASKIMGRVTALSVQEGDRVTAGKLLMKIDSGEITAQMLQAQAAYNNAKLQYDRIKSLFDAAASTQMEMEQATLGLETAKAGLQAAKAMESYTIITAPISGQVVEKRINIGEMALPGQPLLKIEDNSNLRLEVTVNEQDILSIRPGAKVKVRIDAAPQSEIVGTIAQVVPASDVRTHSFIVKVDVPKVRGLITGMYGKAFFSTGKKETILVPKDAVVELAGITGVYVVGTDGNALFQMVQLGQEHGSEVEVLTGLKAGDKVVADQKSGRLEGKKIVFAEK